MKEPKPAPIPELCTSPATCKYHPEIEIVRELKKNGIFEVLSAHRRREKVHFAIIGVLLSACVGLSVTGISVVSKVSHGAGRRESEVSLRLQQQEVRVEQNTQEISRISRSNEDSRSTILVQLGRIAEQLTALDARMERMENVPRRR